MIVTPVESIRGHLQRTGRTHEHGHSRREREKITLAIGINTSRTKKKNGENEGEKRKNLTEESNDQQSHSSCFQGKE